jgi:hypothetical protein
MLMSAQQIRALTEDARMALINLFATALLDTAERDVKLISTNVVRILANMEDYALTY